jgi:hypothetical protein
VTMIDGWLGSRCILCAIVRLRSINVMIGEYPVVRPGALDGIPRNFYCLHKYRANHFANWLSKQQCN